MFSWSLRDKTKLHVYGLKCKFHVLHVIVACDCQKLSFYHQGCLESSKSKLYLHWCNPTVKMYYYVGVTVSSITHHILPVN